MPTTPTTLFVTCARRLEPILIEELVALGLPRRRLRQGGRGVYVREASFQEVYLINYCARVASRVFWPLGRFRCQDRHTLYRGAASLPWEQLLAADATIAVEAHIEGQHPELRHSHFAALVVKDALCDRLRDKRGSRPSVDRVDPTVSLHLYLSRGEATLSWDTSGPPLHKRGYRQDGGEAPLQETLAAAILALIGFRGQGAFCDPMCGSGTLLIEAGLIATATPPGFLRRRWGFMAHPSFDQQDWLRVKNKADSQRRLRPHYPLYGMERDPSALASCQSNLRAAGLSAHVTLVPGDCQDWQGGPLFAFMAVNPPYGVRLKSIDPLKDLLTAFARTHAAPHAVVAVLSPEDLPLSFSEFSVERRFPLMNGGLPVTLHCLS